MPDSCSRLPSENIQHCEDVLSESCADIERRPREDIDLAPLSRKAFIDTKSSHGGSEMPSSPVFQGTLISRQWYYVMPSALMTYILLQIAISNSHANICGLDDPYAQWTQTVAVAVLACYALSVIYHFTNGISVTCWAEKELHHLRGVYASAATVCFIGGAGTGLFSCVLGMTPTG